MRAERLLLYCASTGLAKSPPLDISADSQPFSSFFSNNPKFWIRCEERGIFIHCLWERTPLRPLHLDTRNLTEAT